MRTNAVSSPLFLFAIQLVATGGSSVVSERKAGDRRLLRRDTDEPAPTSDQREPAGITANTSDAAGAPNMSVTASDRPIAQSVHFESEFRARLSFQDACQDLSKFLTQTSSMKSYDHLGAGLSNMNEDAILLIGTEHMVCQLDNFLVHAQKARRDRRFFVACLDDKVHEFCEQLQRRTITCLDLRGWIPDVNESFRHDLKQNNAGYMTCLYKMIVWSKPAIFKKLLEALPPTVLLGVFDVDIVLQRGPDGDILDYLRNMWELEWTLVVGSEINGLANTGSVLGFATDRTRAMVTDWLSYASKHQDATAVWGDQAGFNTMRRDHHIPDRYFERDPKHLHQAVFYIPDSKLGQFGSMKAYGGHFNACHPKVKAMHNKGLWHTTVPGCSLTDEDGHQHHLHHDLFHEHVHSARSNKTALCAAEE